MAYVAFSRAKTRKDDAVKFPIFELARIMRIRTHQQFKDRIAEDTCLANLAVQTRAEFIRFVPPVSYELRTRTVDGVLIPFGRVSFVFVSVRCRSPRVAPWFYLAPSWFVVIAPAPPFLLLSRTSLLPFPISTAWWPVKTVHGLVFFNKIRLAMAMVN